MKHVAHLHHPASQIALRWHRGTATACLSLALVLSAGAAARAQFDVETKLTASDVARHDFFGDSVAISGNMAIVGASFDDDACPDPFNCNSGSAYVFNLTTGTQTKLTALDAAKGDRFGYSVGISGNMAIVGTDKERVNINQSGSAYLFNLTTGTQTKLTALDAAEGDRFGFSLAISGNTAVVGAFGDRNAGSIDAGAAYLFDVNTGEQRFKLTAFDGALRDGFGWSVAISGNTAIVGAIGDVHEGLASGSAYLFDVTTGDQLKKLTASDAAGSDSFGFSVAIDGNMAIVGSHGNRDAGSFSGSAYLFDVTTGMEFFKLTASDAAEGVRFGNSVGISGNTAIVGAFLDDDACPENMFCNSGSAYLFDAVTGEQFRKLTASDASLGNIFGDSVAISGDTAIVGAKLNDISGSAYLFTAGGPPSDLTNNGFVDFEDLTILLANWNKPGATPAEGNLVDAEGTTVNFEDLTVLLADWTGPGPAASPEAALGAEAVPEPSSLLLALVAMLGVCLRRRRHRAFLTPAVSRRALTCLPFM